MGIKLNNNKPTIACKVFEDNSGALEIANTYKFYPRTKHINVKLYHFCNYVTRGDIKVAAVNIKIQLADFLTKLMNEETLLWLRRLVMGW